MVETPLRAVNLLGMNFSLSIALGSILNDIIKADLSIYGIDTDNFIKSSSVSMNLTKKWIGVTDEVLAEELALAAFLQEIGKFIVSDIVKSKNQAENFKRDIEGEVDVRNIERKYTGYYVSEITAKIFKHWKLSPNLIDNIEFVDHIDKAYESCKKKAQILDVIKTISDIREPLNDKAIELGRKKAQSYGFNISKLDKAIEKVKDNLLG